MSPLTACLLSNAFKFPTFLAAASSFPAKCNLHNSKQLNSRATYRLYQKKKGNWPQTLSIIRTPYLAFDCVHTHIGTNNALPKLILF